MGIVRTIAEVETWLDAEAESWSSLPDPEYKLLVRRWSNRFSPLIEADAAALEGIRAMLWFQELLPVDCYILSGVKVPRLANMGGLGAAAYQAGGVQKVPRQLINSLELILIAIDFTWSYVFSHEELDAIWLCERDEYSSQAVP